MIHTNVPALSKLRIQRGCRRVTTPGDECLMEVGRGEHSGTEESQLVWLPKEGMAQHRGSWLGNEAGRGEGQANGIALSRTEVAGDTAHLGGHRQSEHGQNRGQRLGEVLPDYKVETTASWPLSGHRLGQTKKGRCCRKIHGRDGRGFEG